MWKWSYLLWNKDLKKLLHSYLLQQFDFSPSTCNEVSTSMPLYMYVHYVTPTQTHMKHYSQSNGLIKVIIWWFYYAAMTYKIYTSLCTIMMHDNEVSVFKITEENIPSYLGEGGETVYTMLEQEETQWQWIQINRAVWNKYKYTILWITCTCEEGL